MRDKGRRREAWGTDRWGEKDSANAWKKIKELFPTLADLHVVIFDGSSTSCLLGVLQTTIRFDWSLIIVDRTEMEQSWITWHKSSPILQMRTSRPLKKTWKRLSNHKNCKNNLCRLYLLWKRCHSHATEWKHGSGTIDAAGTPSFQTITPLLMSD